MKRPPARDSISTAKMPAALETVAPGPSLVSPVGNPPRFEAIAIGASAGAIEALSVILPALPQNFALPIFVVVHLPPDKDSLLSPLFSSRCKIRVKEAEDKEPIEPSTLYFAAPNYHLLIEPDFRLSLSSDEPVLYSRPSIDVLFESAADAYGSGLLSIILSGANGDGAVGVQAVTRAGGSAWVQRPETAIASAMPIAALKASPKACAMSLEEIARKLGEILNSKDHAKS